MARRDDEVLKALWDEAHAAYERLRTEQAQLGKHAKELRPLEDDFHTKHQRWWGAKTDAGDL
jgi:hypothetical protein